MKEIICKECGELKIHEGKGLCKKCYAKYYYNKVYNKVTRIGFLGKIIIAPNLPKQPPGYVYHHLIYDYNNPTENVILMKNGEHRSYHKYMKSIGEIVPIINKPKE